MIYGLGKVGRGYIKQIKSSHWCKIIGVSDKSIDTNVYGYKFYKLEEISALHNVNKVIISIGNQEITAKIEKEMIGCGIPKEKIFRMGNKRYAESYIVD